MLGSCIKRGQRTSESYNLVCTINMKTVSLLAFKIKQRRMKVYEGQHVCARESIVFCDNFNLFDIYFVGGGVTGTVFQFIYNFILISYYISSTYIYFTQKRKSPPHTTHFCGPESKKIQIGIYIYICVCTC